MQWLRQWFRRQVARPAAVAPRAQLRVEPLEQRDVPSASTFVDLAGTRIEFDVDANHRLIEKDPLGTHTLAGGVEFVHLFRDPHGRLGVDLVFTNGQYVTIDAGGFHLVAPNILTARTSFDASG